MRCPGHWRGGAGLRSAIEASENGARVIVVSKTKVGYGNNTIMSKAILASPGWGDSSDNPQVYLRDTVIGGRYINDQELVIQSNMPGLALAQMTCSR